MSRKNVVNKLEKIQKTFLWNNSTPKMKHETLCNGYKTEELKNVGIANKIMSLQCAWIRRLYDDSFLELKLIPLYLIEKWFALLLKFSQIFSLKVIKPRFSHLSIGKLFWTGKNIWLWWLKYILAYCLNICVTIRASRWIKPLFNF